MFSLWLLDLIYIFFTWIRKKKNMFLSDLSLFSIIIVIDVYFGCWLFVTILFIVFVCLLACLYLTHSDHFFWPIFVCLIAACSFTLCHCRSAIIFRTFKYVLYTCVMCGFLHKWCVNVLFYLFFSYIFSFSSFFISCLPSQYLFTVCTNFKQIKANCF